MSVVTKLLIGAVVIVAAALSLSNVFAPFQDDVPDPGTVPSPERKSFPVHHAPFETGKPLAASTGTIEASVAIAAVEPWGFAAILSKGAAPDATWKQKMRAADVLMRCRGFGHQRTLTTASFSETMAPEAFRELEAGIRWRAAQCHDLLRLHGKDIAAMEAELIADLTKEGAPFSAPVLRNADGSALSAEALDSAKAQMRKWLETLGPEALVPMSQTLRELAGIAVASGQSNRWTEAMADDAYAEAVDAAVCRSVLDCNGDVEFFTNRCLLTGRCPVGVDTGNEPNRNLEWLTEQLVIAIRNRDWQRIGL
ncbi:hypothetical protein M5C99_08565 [Acidovorax sp. NCPPB 2350]|nr:hypothetical protein M5C99_08565 [Acidovorax sp. NCPPB 2350]